MLSSFRLVNLSFLSICTFFDLYFCWSVIFPMCHFVNVSFFRCVILSICHFVDLSFYEIGILSICHFVDQSFCRSVILSICPMYMSTGNDLSQAEMSCPVQRSGKKVDSTFSCAASLSANWLQWLCLVLSCNLTKSCYPKKSGGCRKQKIWRNQIGPFYCGLIQVRIGLRSAVNACREASLGV
jgi:hypothetical protein